MANLSITNNTRMKAVTTAVVATKPQTTPVPVSLPAVTITPLSTNSVVPGSSRTRPLWFDGRFLSAQDLTRDQNYFLQGQATLGQAAGFGVIHGLTVNQALSAGVPDAETIVIAAGQGVTPNGGLVMLSSDLTVNISDLEEEQELNDQFDLAETPTAIERTRTGLYVIALRPLQFTANPITSYPTNIQGSRTAQDGSIVEATGVSLVPFPVPQTNSDSMSQNAAAARQVFVENAAGALSPSLLPIAMIAVERGVIQWLDEWMVRRESGPEFNTLRFGLANIATQQAYLRQFDAQLQQIVAPIIKAGQTANFPASTYFQALPPAGRFPVAAINTTALTQVFLPPQTNTTLSLIAEDELAALIDEGMSLSPIDLTQPADSYADLSVLLLIPVPRKNFASLSATLQPVALSGNVPLAISVRSPIDLLRLFKLTPVPSTTSTTALTWQTAIGQQTYGYFIRRRSAPQFVTSALASTTTTLLLGAVTGSQATQYSATVTPSAATGTVVFKDGTTVLGTADIHSGTATLVLPVAAGTSHSFTASYQGDTNYAASSSPASGS